MRILYHIKCIETIYAARFIYEGYKAAFEDKGHIFRQYTANDDLEKVLCKFNP